MSVFKCMICGCNLESEKVSAIRFHLNVKHILEVLRIDDVTPKKEFFGEFIYG